MNVIVTYFQCGSITFEFKVTNCLISANIVSARIYTNIYCTEYRHLVINNSL